MIGRRLALAGAVAMPGVARAQAARVLRMVPQANLASFDPIFSTANITRNYGSSDHDRVHRSHADSEPGLNSASAT